MPRENWRAVWLKLFGFAAAREAVEFCEKFSNWVLDPSRRNLTADSDRRLTASAFAPAYLSARTAMPS
jgi:hypothetical protein